MFPSVLSIFDDFFDSTLLVLVSAQVTLQSSIRLRLVRFSDDYFHPRVNHMDWLEKYNEVVFFQLFRMTRNTFSQLLAVVLHNDQHCLIKKRYRGGNFPFAPEKNLLIFLWYIAHQDPLISIADRFGIVQSSVMVIVNAFLYIACRLKYKYIKWPTTDIDQTHIQSGFPSFPGVFGAIDGTHINLTVPVTQQDSYIDRFQHLSIDLAAICTAEKLFTYVFVGFPGCAHDARVFSYSLLYREIEQYGKIKYFPTETLHIIGDSANPLRVSKMGYWTPVVSLNENKKYFTPSPHKVWLMVPFKGTNLNAKQKYFNFCLSSARVNIENAFAFLKGRWARLKCMNTYSISKAIEISIAACVVHNFCIINHDQWDGVEYFEEPYPAEDFSDDNRLQNLMGEVKKNNLMKNLWAARNRRRNI